MSKLDEVFDKAVRAFARDNLIETRYPYTYSADFLRSHPDILPSEYGGIRPDSRGEADEVIEMWAMDLDVSKEDLAKTLADAYIVEYHLLKP
jgi:hypothetical protein